MDSGNANVANDTASGSHLGNEEGPSTWCENTVIGLSVLMTINMIALMWCYRMFLLGKFRPPELTRVFSAGHETTRAPGALDEGSRSHRPSSDSFFFPPLTNLGPSTVVVNNIGLYSVDVAKNSSAKKREEPRVVMVHNPTFSMESPDLGEAEVIKAGERQRKISVFMDRPLPELPEQGEKKMNTVADGPERKMEITTSVVQRDVVSNAPTGLKHAESEDSGIGTESKPELFVDIELFI